MSLRVREFDELKTHATHRTLHFEVEDTGVGIAEDEIPQIFDYFQQTGSGLEAGGTGLGLAISREYVHLMGGDITVTSQVGQGSVFGFDIQVEEGDFRYIEEQETQHLVIGLQPDQAEIRILVADDRETNRMLLTKMLTAVGFQVREAVNGQEAIAIFEEWQPHLILMDMVMPVLDGFKATERIKATPQGQEIAIIAVTASVLEEDRQKVLATGVDYFIRKPFKESDLFAKIRACLGIEYVYEEEDALAVQSETEVEVAPLTRESLLTLPVELVDQMRQALLNGYMSRLTELTEQVVEHDAQLAMTLRNLVSDYEYDILFSLFEKREE